MRDCINIIDKNTLEVKGSKYSIGDTSLVFVLMCLVREYDDLKLVYDRLLEQHQKVIKIKSTEDNAYVMSFLDLANRLDINKQTLMVITSRAEFDKYRTYVTVPRKRPALIVTKNSLKLLYTYLNEKTRIEFSQQKFKTLLRSITDGYSC